MPTTRATQHGDGAPDLDGPVPPTDPDAPLQARTPEERVSARLWWAAGLVWRRKWWIGLGSLAVAVAAVVLTLQIPNRYQASTRLLLPDSGGGLGALIGSAVPGAAALFGGGGGYTRYLAILTSRSTYREVVQTYDLVKAYETGESRNPESSAIAELAERTSFDVNLEFDYLSVRVLDEDPETAADMANTFVAILNRRNAELNQESASTYRVYLENRLARAESAVDSLTAEMQAFQERYGVIEIEAQSGALMAALAEASAAVTTAEVEVEMLRAEFGPDNDRVRTAEAGLAEARRQRSRLTSGGDAMMPVPLGTLPAVGRQYAQIQQGLLMQTEIVRELLPLYEQSLLTERREADAVQVLDRAEPPTRKAEPRRSVIVLAAALSAFLVLSVLALALGVARSVGPVVLGRLRAGA